MITTRNVEYRLTPTGAHHSLLEPITLTIRATGPMSFQDYLTPDEAQLLGEQLIAMAASTRAEVLA